MSSVAGSWKTGIRFSFLFVMLGIVAVVAIGCSGGNQSANLNETGELPLGQAPLSIPNFPAPGSSGLIDLANLPIGNYKLQKFRIYIAENGDSHIFEHSLAVPGILTGSETRRFEAKWSSDKTERNATYTLNLPLALENVSGPTPNFIERHEYLHKVSSTGKESFWISPAESARGFNFSKIYTPVLLKDLIYVNPMAGGGEVAGAARLHANGITLFYKQLGAAADIVMELTYAK